MLLKIAPDVTQEQLTDIISILREIDMAGIIATNTTLSRENLVTPASTVEAIGAGGLSGAPLTQRSREIVSTLFRELKGEVPIVGVGGVMAPEDAWQMVLAGASLVQLYTGFVYGGPGIVRDMNRHIAKRLVERDFKSIAAAVGQGN